MVGLQTLNLAIGVRVPASQPKKLLRSTFDKKLAKRFFSEVAEWLMRRP